MVARLGSLPGRIVTHLKSSRCSPKPHSITKPCPMTACSCCSLSFWHLLSALELVLARYRSKRLKWLQGSGVLQYRLASYLGTSRASRTVAINFERIMGGAVTPQLPGKSYNSIIYNHVLSEGPCRPSGRSHNDLHGYACTPLSTARNTII
jgi:hypothetical protein